MTVPSALLTVTGSPITSSGTFAVTLGTRAANLVFAGPTTGSAATPTFRSLVAADLPWTLNGNTTVLATVSGTYTTHDLLYADGSGNTADSGILYSAFPLANLATQANNTVVGNTSGSGAAPSALTALPLPTDYALPVAVCQNTTASAAGSLPTSSPAVAACNTGTHVQQGVLQYAASSDLFWQTHFPMPVDVTTSSTIDYYLTWYSATTSGNVVWTIGYACIAAGAVADASFTTTTTPAAAAAGTTLQYVHSSKTGVTGCAAGNELQLQIERNAGSGSDTMSGTANLVSLTIVVRRTVAIGG